MRDLDFLNIMMKRAKIVGEVVAVHKKDLHTGWKYIVYTPDCTSYYATFAETLAYLGRLIPENNRIMERLYEEAC